MRVLIVATLLFFNVALALWHVGGASGSAAQRMLPSTEPGVEPLVLWSERPEPVHARPPVVEAPAQAQMAAEPPPAAQESEVAPPPEPPALPPVCGRIGPFADRQAAAGASAQLAEFGWRMETVADAAVEVRYWVLLPPRASTAEAFRIDRALRREGIRDLQVLAGEGRDNAISLGLFKDQAMADRRLEQIRGLGYEPQMEALERRRAQFWVQFTTGSGDGPPDQRPWRQAVAEAGDLRLELQPCAPEEPMAGR